MITIVVPENECWDPFTEQFIYIKKTKLNLEHSLISLSKWESEYQKSFLDENTHSIQEITDYVKCMTLDKGVDPNVYFGLSSENVKQIVEYMNKPMTGATFKDSKWRRPRRNEKTTAETLYWMMIELGIPFDPCEKWHLNRLLALIHFCQVKQTPGKKMPINEILKGNTSLNAMRRAKLHSKG